MWLLVILIPAYVLASGRRSRNKNEREIRKIFFVTFCVLFVSCRIFLLMGSLYNQGLILNSYKVFILYYMYSIYIKEIKFL